MDIVTLFCEIDDFCQRIEPWLNQQLLPGRQREREMWMHLSEVITILVLPIPGVLPNPRWVFVPMTRFYPLLFFNSLLSN
jgi:hypothetical protein